MALTSAAHIYAYYVGALLVGTAYGFASLFVWTVLILFWWSVNYALSLKSVMFLLLLFVEIFFLIRRFLLSVKVDSFLSHYSTYFSDFLKYGLKKYIYTINHKRIAINYLIFCLVSGMAGTLLATMIRLELAMPGSFFFKYDSVRYLQVITAHGLTMIFFVVIPLVFGAVANFLIPYHIGSKDVAFPRLNSLGF